MILQSYRKSFKFFPHIRPTYWAIERLTIQYNTTDVDNFTSDIHFLIFTQGTCLLNPASNASELT